MSAFGAAPPAHEVPEGSGDSAASLPSSLDGSAIGRLIRANGNRIPRNLQEWSTAIGEHGEGPVRQSILPRCRASCNPSREFDLDRGTPRTFRCPGDPVGGAFDTTNH